ncbi:NHL repeat-containing protein [Curtobacterium sp. MCSS17_016]|uniref:NHL repeat-containing protein n=1 Tax=Curtobacterium sp. MCSS17_016 TaxID=2175644 RepID=UPI0011B4D02E|nr:NHL repeat-containing protein [Curtobacterium sp. MCSS17_016]WIE80883.1 NHL repeat-containing protein [Curtobacterium sp. MCSS17_016]
MSLTLLIGGGFTVAGVIASAADANAKQDLNRVAVTESAYANANQTYASYSSASDATLSSTPVGFTPSGRLTVTGAPCGWVGAATSTTGNVFLRSSATARTTTDPAAAAIPSCMPSTAVQDVLAAAKVQKRAANQVSTIAGSTTAGAADGVGSAARFNLPFSLTPAADGSMIVADQAGQTIRRVAQNGAVTTIAGTGSRGTADGPAATAQFNDPSDVAVDGLGNIYVTDYGSYTIRKITPAGLVSTYAGVPGTAGYRDGPAAQAQFAGAYGLTTDLNGNLYVADGDNRVIRKITTDGTVTTIAGKPGFSGSTDGPVGTGTLSAPRELAFDPQGNLIIVDKSNRIRRLTPDGALSTVAGDGQPNETDGRGTAASFNTPTGLAVASDGTIYVSDTYGCTIRRITPSGDVTTIAGTPNISGTTDGPASTARFRQLRGLALDPAGNLWATDSANNSIRVVGAP